MLMVYSPESSAALQLIPGSIPTAIARQSIQPISFFERCLIFRFLRIRFCEFFSDIRVSGPPQGRLPKMPQPPAAHSRRSPPFSSEEPV
jgi:hypothetical protein